MAHEPLVRHPPKRRQPLRLDDLMAAIKGPLGRAQSYKTTPDLLAAVNGVHDRANANVAALNAVAPPAAPAAEEFAALSAAPAPALAAGAAGSPNKQNYVAPFDEAEKRAREAAAAAVPVITEAYAKLVERLKGNAAEYGATSQRISGEQQARQAQGQEQVRTLNAPALADLGATFGPDALGSLTGAVGAAAAQQQANLTEQGSRQRALAAELAAQQARSGQTRIEDTDLAKTSALAATQGNLNNILGQLGIARAGAERQFAGDLTQWERQREELAARAAASGGDPLDQELKSLRIEEARQKLAGGPDLDDVLKQLTIEEKLDKRNPKPTRREALEAALAKPQPGKGRAKGLFEMIVNANTDRKGAYEDLAAFQSGHDAFDNVKKPGTYQGARISPSVIRRWLDDWYSTK